MISKDHDYLYENLFTAIDSKDSSKPIGARNHNNNSNETEVLSGPYLSKMTVSTIQLSSKYIMQVIHFIEEKE